jgi:tripartite-type tricarboxylate transporter receptor subunit TctC
MTSMKRLIAALLAAASLASAAHAQQFPIPGKPIRIIVPLAAGGGADVQARIVGKAIAETLGVPIIIDNKPGASTLIGTKELMRAAPDGHTLLYTISLFVQLPLLLRNPPWDVFKDFAPITSFVRSFTVLTAHESAPFNTVAELVAYAKANPGKLSFGSPGPGSGGHLNGEKLKRLAGIDIVHIPYKGAGDAMRDHLSGNLTLLFDGPTTAMANVQTGRVKYIATAAETRSAMLPNLPTLREEGYDVGRRGYQLLLGPPGMSPDIVNAIHKHVDLALSRPDVAALLQSTGNELARFSPQETAAEIRRSYDYNAALITEIGVKLD